MIIFPDTQFFLHFKDAWDIPWCEKIQADPITLLVCKTVQKEIEKHKNEQRGRPQDRARKYATRLAQVVVDDAPLVLRENGPRVLLDFKSANPQNWSRPKTLDAG